MPRRVYKLIPESIRTLFLENPYVLIFIWILMIANSKIEHVLAVIMGGFLFLFLDFKTHILEQEPEPEVKQEPTVKTAEEKFAESNETYRDIFLK